MNKHTAGPWELSSEPVRHFWQIFGDYKLVASVPAGGKRNNEAQRQQKVADARLICAAPDLLEALDALLESYCSAMANEYDYPGSPWTPERDDDEAALRAIAVLKKTRGES